MSPQNPKHKYEQKHEEAMGLAIAEAEKALEHRDVPIGAVVLQDSKVIASRHNEKELHGDPTAHAEILALSDAAKVLGDWRLEGTTLVVTLEPCAMCAGAALAGRISKLVFGAYDPKAGACGSLYNLSCDPRLNHSFETTGGVAERECSALLSDFFKTRRG